MADVVMSDAPASPPRVYTASHENETHANAADGSLLEACKENAEPLRRGRDPHKLLKALGVKVPAAAPVADGTAPAVQPTPSVKPEAALKAERKALEAAIKGYTGDKPLDPWLAYIKWTQQSYATAAPASHLLPLLEKCTRAFLKDERVRHSLAYLQVWFQYMDAVDDSLDMFSFLHLQGIGVKHAQLFEGWSLVLERRGRTQDALDALQLGLNSGAEPAWRLKNARERMQARIARNIAQAVAANSQAFADAPPPATHEARVAAAAQRLADENGTSVRQPLQRIGSAREPVVERPVNGQTIYAAPAPGAGIAARAASNNPFAAARKVGSASTGNSSNFQVFCDEGLAGGAPSSTSMPAPFASFVAPAAASAGAPAPVWNEYATVSSSSKENRDKTGSWSQPLNAPPAADAGAEGRIVTLPPALPKAFSNIAVFVDADCAAADLRAKAAQSVDAASAAAGSNPRKRLESGSGVLQASSDKASHVSLAKLTSQPLRHMSASAKPSSSSSSAKPASK